MKTTPLDAMKVIVAGGHSFTDKRMVCRSIGTAY